MTKKRYGILALGCLALVLLGCPADSGTTSATVDSVTVSPKTVTVAKGETQQFTATVNGTGNPAQSVTWEVTGGGTGTAVNTSGLLTVADGETAASLTVKATSTADTTKSDTATVTVTNPPPPPPEDPVITGVTISPTSATVAKGGIQQFTAVVDGENNPPQTVTWAVTGGGTGTTIAGGLLTVALSETAASLTVTAVSTVDDTKSDTVTVTISGTVTVSSVTVSPTNANVAKGGTQQFTATVSGTGNPAQSVTWAVTGGGTGTVINSGGLLTVAAGETAISLTVRATSTTDTTQSGTANVTVTETSTPDALTGVVLITGNPRAGNTLTANTANLFGTGIISYQWQWGTAANGSFTNIPGATTATYSPVTSNVSNYLKVTVIRAGYTGSVTSDAVGPVQAAPTDTGQITGSITVVNGIDNVTVDFTDAGTLPLNKTGTLTVTVSGAYQAYRWYVDTVSLADETAGSITLNGSDYTVGNHRILVIVYKNNIPYSHEIGFTVSN